MAGVGLGCNNIDSESANSAGSAASENAEPGTFAWPADPSHPVMTLDILSPAVEGRVHIELMPELAPSTVAEIINLAGEGFYNGTTFHRVIRNFMIQGGDPKSRDRDPSNDGKGGAATRLMDEFGDAPFERSVVGIANLGRKDSSSTQFFILHKDSRYLDGRYTVIGRVVDGMDVVDEITQVATDKVGRWGPKDRPIENVVMTRVQLSGQIGALVAAGEVVLASTEDADAADVPTTEAAQAEAPSAKTDANTVTASN